MRKKTAPIAAGRQTSYVDLHLGMQLKARRLMADMSQTELARRAGISYQQIQKYESGINRMSAAHLYTFAKALGCSTNSFFEGLKDGASDPANPLLSDAEVNILRALRDLGGNNKKLAVDFLKFLLSKNKSAITKPSKR